MREAEGGGEKTEDDVAKEPTDLISAWNYVVFETARDKKKL